MHCFFCGALNASLESLDIYDVPICRNCQKSNDNSKYYKPNRNTGYNHKYIISPEVLVLKDCTCFFCNQNFKSDKIMENYGFSKEACDKCIEDPNKNLELSNRYLQPIWRDRNQL